MRDVAGMMGGMDRPRLLLVPMLTELEWVIRPQLEEWAEVACYDAPGVGAEGSRETVGASEVARRGLEEVDRLGWDRFVVVADEFGVPAAARIAEAAGPRLQALALGHARMSNAIGGERPSVNREVLLACESMMRSDVRTFVRQMFKMTGGEQSAGGYRDDLVEEYARRVPRELAMHFYDSATIEDVVIGPLLETLDVPMLLAHHRGCLMFTREGFQDAVAALPHARTATFDEKPSTSPEFAQLLREFCASLAAARA